LTVYNAVTGDHIGQLSGYFPHDSNIQSVLVILVLWDHKLYVVLVGKWGSAHVLGGVTHVPSFYKTFATIFLIQATLRPSLFIRLLLMPRTGLLTLLHINQGTKKKHS